MDIVTPAHIGCIGIAGIDPIEKPLPFDRLIVAQGDTKIPSRIKPDRKLTKFLG